MTYKSSLFLAFTFLLIINALSQNPVRINHSIYFDSDSIDLKESYSVLKKYPEIKDSLYCSYSKDGFIQEQGNYIKGIKTGTWFGCDQFQPIYYGVFSNDGNYSGIKIQKSIQTLSFYHLDTLTESSDSIRLLWFEKLTSELRNIIEVPEEPANRITSQKASEVDTLQLDSIRTDSLKLVENYSDSVLYRLILDLIYIPQKERISNELSGLRSEIGQCSFASDSIKDNFYFKIDSCLSLEDYHPKISFGREIIKEWNVYFKLAALVYHENEKLNMELQELKLHLSENSMSPELHTSYSYQADSLSRLPDLQQKKKAIQAMNKTLDQLNSELKQMKSIQALLKAKRDSLEFLTKKKYPLLYSNSVEPYVNKSITPNSDQTIKAQCDAFADLENDLDSLIAIVMDIIDSDEFIEENLSPLSDGYFQKYPSIFKKEIRPLNQKKSDFNRAKDINQMNLLGKQLADTIRYYQESYLAFQHIDTLVSIVFEELKKNYSSEFRPIYKNEISRVESLAKNYNMSSVASVKTKTSKDLQEQIDLLSKNYILLDEQKKLIDEKFPVLATDFENDFESVYKGSIRMLGDEIKTFENLPSSAIRLEKGKLILDKISEYRGNYDTLKIQKNEIARLSSDVNLAYQSVFSQIYKNEIKDLQADIKSYDDIQLIDPKFKQGSIIIERLNQLKGNFEGLKENDSFIQQEFELMVEGYKGNYQEIYKTRISELIDIEKEYSNAGYHVKKLNLGNQLVSSVKLYNEKLALFEEQKQTLSSKYQEFEMYFQNRKNEKYIYKRGKSAYNDLMDLYEKEIDLDKKQGKGDEIRLLLDQLISLANKDNSFLNGELKDAKSTLDILKKIGVR